MKKQLEGVKLFHETFGAPVEALPTANIPLERKILRYELMKEENEEYQEAVEKNDIIGIADALGDMMYILCGTIIEHGLQHKIEAVFDEIQRSNMSKLGEDGKPIYREDGKVMKGPGYSKPSLEKIVTSPDRNFISIAAISKNGVLAIDGKIPWNLPNDFKHFKKVTSGHHIIMGRKTFESLPGLLPNRTHIVITRDKSQIGVFKITDPEVIVVSSLEEAIDCCPAGTSYIIGGGEIYSQAMSVIDELDLTIVDVNIASVGGERTLFPSAEEFMGKFKIISREDYKSDDKHQFNYSFLKLSRRTS